MNETSSAVEYYNDHYKEFALQVADKAKNSFEYEFNMAAILKMVDKFNGRTLDYGCGAGNFTVLLSRKGRVVEGCDSSKSLIKLARKKYPNFNFFYCDTTGLLPENKQYDLIIAKLVFHYVTDIEQLLKNITANLKPDGYICISVPHPDKTARFFQVPTPEGVYRDQIGNFNVILEMVHRSKERWKEVANDCNLVLVSSISVPETSTPKRLNIILQKRAC